MRSLKDRHHGATVFVCGTSPHIQRLNPYWLRQGVTIGINTWFRYRPCNYWICADSSAKAWQQWGDDLYNIKAERFMSRPASGEIVPDDLAHYWFEGIKSFPDDFQWRGTLHSNRTTATAAVHLAMIMGAREIVLWGVDIMGGERFDGSANEYGPWENRFHTVNRSIKNFAKWGTIYKTNPKSPLEVPLWPPLNR